MPPRRNRDINDIYEQELEQRIMERMDERFNQIVDQLANRMNDMMNPKRRRDRNSRGSEGEESENPRWKSGMRVNIPEFDGNTLNPEGFIDRLVAVEEVFEFKEGTKSVEDYTTEFYQLIAKNDIQETDDQLVSHYTSGLRVQIMDSVNMFNPVTLSGLKCFNYGEPGHRQSKCKKDGKRHLFVDKEWEDNGVADDDYKEPLVFDDDQYEATSFCVESWLYLMLKRQFKKLGLKTENRPKPYKLQWLKKGGEVTVSKRFEQALGLLSKSPLAEDANGDALLALVPNNGKEFESLSRTTLSNGKLDYHGEPLISDYREGKKAISASPPSPDLRPAIGAYLMSVTWWISSLNDFWFRLVHWKSSDRILDERLDVSLVSRLYQLLPASLAVEGFSFGTFRSRYEIKRLTRLGDGDKANISNDSHVLRLKASKSGPLNKLPGKSRSSVLDDLGSSGPMRRTRQKTPSLISSQPAWELEGSNGSKMADKRRSYVLDDLGSGGPMRRIRQKADLCSQGSSLSKHKSEFDSSAIVENRETRMRNSGYGFEKPSSSRLAGTTETATKLASNLAQGAEQNRDTSMHGLGSGGPLRRTRQKANLLTLRDKRELGYTTLQQPDDAISEKRLLLMERCLNQKIVKGSETK
ncbi:hypothetical protein Tco_1327477 [Tanacetum coccineum]